MKKLTFMIIASILFLFFMQCSPAIQTQEDQAMIFDRENLIAWCIIPFDAAQRNPLQRAMMLNQLGITRLAWDWRMEHIPLLEEEINTLRDHNIELSAVWFWIDNNLEEGLLPHQEQILQTLHDTGTRTTLWVCFHDNYFENLSQQEKIDLAVRNLSILNNRASDIGCRIALYNHMHWFGEPENQVQIIKAIGSDNIGIVYNFHHGHHHVENFGEMLQIMMPHLWTININGMNPDGPKILDVGQGEHEAAMIRTILASGYSGDIGIIGHTEGEDIEHVLRRNLLGLEEILEDE
jgi:sugar phosphate isomerase/epimerase